MLHDIVTVQLNYWKFYAIVKLSEVHKKQQMCAALNFLEQCKEDSEEILFHIVTEAETWVLC